MVYFRFGEDSYLRIDSRVTSSLFHRLFYQNAIKMMSNENPSGDIPDADRYRRLLVLCVIVSLASAIKRFFVGLMQGRRLYIRYGEDLSRVMGRALLISKVGKLARDIEAFRLRFNNFDFNVCTYDGSAADDASKSTSSDAQGLNAAPLTPGFYSASNSKKARLIELLGEWEEPEVLEASEVISFVYLFRSTQVRRGQDWHDICLLVV
jgi:hypothetical protein